jgi:hypothetical protein
MLGEGEEREGEGEREKEERWERGERGEEGGKRSSDEVAISDIFPTKDKFGPGPGPGAVATFAAREDFLGPGVGFGPDS